MNGPSDSLRREVQRQCEQLRGTRASNGLVVDAALEDGLERILDVIGEELTRALDGGRTVEPDETIARIDAWAPLASYAVVRTYGPESPWWGGRAGWRASAVKKLRGLAGRLGSELEHAAVSLGADSWSVGVSFPAGLAIALSWSTGTTRRKTQWNKDADAFLDRWHASLERLRSKMPRD